jgi:LPS-assembly protein
MFIAVPPTYAQSNADRWSYCTAQFIPSGLLTTAPPQRDPTDTSIHVTADQARVEDKETFYFEGNVLIQQADKLFNTDYATYQKSTNKLHAEGMVRYQTEQQLVVGERADVFIDDNKATLSNVEFWLMNNHLRGRAHAFDVVDRDTMLLDEVQFTSCDTDDEHWLLKASRMKLDFAKNEGIAHHARVEFMGVPFIYMPYLSMPLVGRKTGFLAPSFGSSEISGTEVSIPYYVNIAPNRDATITPTYFSQRGIQYIGEYRYLRRRGSGKIELEYLPDDDVYKDDRIYSAYYHNGNPAPDWRMNVQLRYASDEEYFDDFSNSLSDSSITHLDRHLTLNYQAKLWRADARLQHYQTLDQSIAPVNRPYQRLPQLQISTNPYFLPWGFETSARGELVNFFRSEGVIGTRLDLAPQLAWRYRTAPGFVEPAVTLRHTRYELEDHDPAIDGTPTRTITQASLDTGLFFERDVVFEDRTLLQTLEPRLFYLHVPYRDQSNLIVDDSGNSRVFDTTLPQFSFAELFRDNRFSGVDRIGDADQLSFSLTSRFFNQSGNELFNASIGQIYYFRDREVTLPNQPVETSRRSDIAVELRSNWNSKWSIKGSALWDNAENSTRRGSTELRYNPGHDKIAYLSYRYERDSIDQADFSFLWPLHRKWKVVGRWYYSFFDDLRLETLAGLEYESCCWSIRLVRRDYITDLEDETRNDSIWVQLELKGLTSVGRTVGSGFETGRFDQNINR